MRRSPGPEMDGRVGEALRGGAVERGQGQAERLRSSLSGGQAAPLHRPHRRAVRPEVILFDEPCSALDPI